MPMQPVPHLSAVPDSPMSNPAGLPDSRSGPPPEAETWDSQWLALEGQYTGQMDMGADHDTVIAYLDRHQEWFERCASPMAVEPIAVDGYALVIGRFRALGYEVEPKIGLHLLPQSAGIYRIETIPVPDYEAPGYEVDFNAAMELQPCAEGDVASTTRVEWDLHLVVKLHMPRFIQALPPALVKTSGDKVLNQIVRQVSKRLTRKVQEDFHQANGLSLPESYHRHRFWSNWGREG